MAIEFDGDFSQIYGQIDKLITSLDNASKAFINTKGDVGGLAAAFNDTKSIQAFIDSLKGVDKVNVDSFKNIASGISSLASAAKNAGALNAGNLDKMIAFAKDFTNLFQSIAIDQSKLDQMKLLSDAIKSLRTVATAAKTITDSISSVKMGAIKTFVSGLEDVMQKISLISTPGDNSKLILQAMRRLSSIADVTKAVNKSIGKSDFTAVNTFVGNLKTFITKLVGINDIAATVDLGELGKTMLSAVRTLAKIGETFSGLQKSNKNFDPKVLGAFIGNVSDLFAKLSTIQTDPAQTKPVRSQGNTVKNLLIVLDDLQKASGKYKLDEFQPFFTLFREIITALESASKVGSTTLSMTPVTKAIQATVNSFAKVDKILKEVDQSSVERFGKLVEQMFRTMKAISTGLSWLPGTQQLELFSKSLQQIGYAFKQFEQFDKNASKGIGIRTAGSVAGLTASLKLISTALSAVPGGEAFSNLSVAMHNLGSGLSGITRFTKYVDAGSIGKLVKSLILITLGLRTASKFAGDTKRLDSFALALKAVADFFNLLGTENRRNPKNFDQFRAAIKEISLGFKDINDIDIDLSKVAALTQAALAVTKLQDLQALGAKNGSGKKGNNFFAGIGIGEITPDLITKGILGAEFHKFLAQAVDDFARAITTIQQRLGQNIKQLGDNIRNLGQTMISSGQQIIQRFGIQNIFGSDAFKTAEDFEKLSSQVKAFGNLSDDQLKVAQKFADEIGIKYPLSANQALDAILNLSKAGLDLNQIMEALPSAADLAAISDNGSIDDTSKLLIQVAGSFNQFTQDVAGGFQNAAVAANIIAQGANASTASVESLQQGLATVGPTANAFGLSLDETVAILAQFSDAGITGAEAGTQLKSILNNMTKATPQVRQEFERLGVSLTDDTGKFRDINDILNDLVKSMTTTKTVTFSRSAGLTAEQKNELDLAQKAYASATRNIIIYQDGLNEAAVNASDTGDKLNEKIARYQQIQANAQAQIQQLTGSQAETERITAQISRSQSQNFATIQKLAGTYGQAGLNVLINAGDDAIKNFVENMGRLPTAAETAQIVLDNLQGDVEQLTGSMQTLLKNAFLPLLARAFRPLTKAATALVNALAGLPQPVISTITNIVVMASTLATAVGGFIIAAGIVLEFGGAILSVVGSLLIIGSNFFLVAGAVVGFIASLGALIVVATVAGAILTTISVAIETFLDLVENNVGGAGDSLDTLNKIFGQLGDSVTRLVNAVGTVAKSIFQPIIDKGNELAGTEIAKFFDGISTAVANLSLDVNNVARVVELFNEFIGIQNFIKQTDIVSALMGDTSKNKTDADFIGNVFKDANKKIIDGFHNTLDKFAKKPFVKAMFGEDVTGQTLYDFFTQVNDTINSIAEAVSNVGQGLIGVLLNQEEGKKKLKDGISVLAGYALELLGSFTGLDFTSTLLNVKNQDFGAAIQTFASTLMTGLKNAIIQNQGPITSAFETLLNFTSGAVLGAASFVAKLLGFDDLATTLAGAREGLISFVKNTIGTIFGLLKGQSLSDALFNNFGPAGLQAARIFNAVGKAIGSVTKIIGNLVKGLFPAGAGGGGGDVLTTVFTSIANILDGLNNNILTPLANGFSGVLDVLINVGNFFGTVLTNIIGTLPSIGVLINGLFSNDVGAAAAAKNVADKMSKSVSEAIGSVFSGLPDLVKDVVKVATDAINSTAVQNIIKFFTDIATTAPDTIAKIASGIGSVFTLAVNAVPRLIANVGNFLGSTFLLELANSFGGGSKSGRIAAGGGQTSGPVQVIANAIYATIVGAINSIPGLLVGIGNTLGIPVLTQIGNMIKEKGVGDTLLALAQSIADVIISAIDTVPSLIQQAGKTLGSKFLQDLGGALGQSPAEVVTVIANGIKDVITKASQTAGTLLQEAGKTLGSSFLTDLGNQITVGNYGNAIAIIQTNISGVMKKAIEGVPDLLIQAGDALGSTFLTNLGNDLKAGTIGQEVLKAIGDGIQNVVKMAVDTMASGLSTTGGIVASLGTAISGAIVDAINSLTPESIKDAKFTIKADFFGIDLGESNVKLFERLSNALSAIGRVASESIGKSIQSIADAVKLINEQEGGISKLEGLAGVVGILALLRGPLSGVVAAIKEFGLNQVAIGLIGDLKDKLLALKTVAVPILAVATAFLLITSALENITALMKDGNWSKFFDQTFIAFSVKVANIIAPLIGINKEIQKADLLTGWKAFTDAIGNMFDALKKRIEGAVGGALDRITFDAQASASNVAILFGLNSNTVDNAILSMKAVFDKALSQEDSMFDKEGIDTLAQSTIALAGTSLQDAAQKGLKGYADKIFTSFQNEIASPSFLTNLAANPIHWQNLISVLVGSDQILPAFQQFAAKYGAEHPDLISQFISTAADEASRLGKSLDITGLIQDFIKNNVITGKVTVDQAIDIVYALANDGRISEDQAASLEAQIRQAIYDLTHKKPPTADANVDVTVDPTVDPNAKDKVDQAVKDATSDTSTDVTVPANVIVDPNAVTPGGVQDAQAATDFTTALQLLYNQADITTQKIISLQTALQNYATLVSIDTLIATSAWSVHSLLFVTQTSQMYSGVLSITNEVGNLTTALLTRAPLMIPPLVIIGVAFATFQRTATYSIQKVIEKLDALILKAQTAATAVGAVSTAAGMSPQTPPDGRASGGPVKANTLYEVNEGGIAELLRLGGRNYLLPGSNGTVIPASQFANGPAATYNPNRTYNTTNNNAPMEVNVYIDAPNGNAQDIAQATSKAVGDVQNGSGNIVRRIRTRGSSAS